MFTQAQLDTLHHEYAKIKTIDPEQASYAKLVESLDSMTKAMLQQLASADIKFISMLAKNRVKVKK